MNNDNMAPMQNPVNKYYREPNAEVRQKKPLIEGSPALPATESINNPNTEPDKPVVKKREINGKLTKGKTPLNLAFKSFMRDDVPAIRNNVITKYVKPAIRNMLWEGGAYILRSLIFKGDPAARMNPGWGNNGFMNYTPGMSRMSVQGNYVPYHKAYGGKDFVPGAQNSTRDLPMSDRYNFSIYVFDLEEDALAILNDFKDTIFRYQLLTCRDALEILGQKTDFTDIKFGWTDLSAANVVQYGNKFYLDLPRPTVLE